MVLVFPAALAAILYYFYRKEEELAGALGKAILVFQAFVVLITNVLSVGDHLSRRMAFLAWAAVFCLFAGLGILKYKKDYFRWKPKPLFDETTLTKTEKAMIVTVIFLLAVLLVGALFTVPYNYDSMTYHLARIGYWIDHENVNYYLTNIDRQLYSPVLSEYNMLYLMLLSGNDLWLNLHQYVSMLITAFYFYKVARMLGTDRTFAVFGVFVYITMPLTITQSITTQNDLSATMWYVLFLYYLLWFIKAEKLSFAKETRKELLEKIVCVSGCVGFAFLMKVSVCASMMFFVPWLIVCCIRRKDKLKDILLCGVTAVGVLLVTISETLIRTYLACGSFMADTTSGDIMVATKNVCYIIVNILKNFSLLITQHLWTWINGFVYRIAISVGALLKVEVNNVAISFHGFDFITYLNTGDDMYSHDRTSSAFAAYFALLAGVLLVIALVALLVRYVKSRRNAGASAVKTKKAGMTSDSIQTEPMQISYGFVISAWLGFGFIMALLRWQPWGSRLMYPALAVTVIAGAHILGAFCRRLKKKWLVIAPLAVLSFVLCLQPIDYNMKQAEKYLAAGCENRPKFYFENNKRYSTYKKLLKKAKKLKAKDIAVVISGDGYDYPLWRMFHDSYPKATLRHILVDDSNMVVQETEKEKEPDCILWIERGRLEIGDTLDYNGTTYTCVFVADSEKAPDSLLIKQTE
ncbi:MAG: glycosyltransferase family 39 protein [Lachnospiraceae bacterium]|nr:glycosyltransferase family 39 protein [Lachnospiraceae bacterium]